MRRLSSLALCLALAAALLFAAAGAAGALPPSQEEWIELTTANFRLLSNAPEAKTAEIGLALERFRQVLGRLSPALELDSPVPTKILVFKSERSFAPYKAASGGSGRDLVGFFLSHSLGNFIALNAYPGRSQALPVIFHEVTHFFLRHNLPFLPLWANEGLAEYYSTFGELAGEVQIGAPVGHHIHTLRTKSMLPVERLFAVDSSSPEYNEREKKGIFYAQSWALIHHLLSGDEESRRQAVELLRRLSAGEEPAAATEASLGISLRDLEGRLLGTVRAGRFPFFRLPVKDLAAPAGYEVRGLPREEVLFHLGDLLAHGRGEQAGEAEEHFRAALQANPRYPEAWRGLGFLARGEGRRGEAEEHLARAVELGSQRARTHALLGDLLLDRLREEGPTAAEDEPSLLWRRAREALLRAHSLDPGFAQAEALLGFTWFYDPAGAAGGIPHLAHALGRLPDRPDIAYNLAMLYLKAGELEGARQVVARNLVPSGREDLVREAEEAIERGALAAAAGRQLERYHRAVELANGGRLREALEELRALLPEIQDEALHRAAESLLAELERALR